MKKRNSIADAILIDAQDTITGVTFEHNYIDQFCMEMQTGISAIEQKLIFENGRKYDMFTILMADDSERILYFEITCFYGRC